MTRAARRKQGGDRTPGPAQQVGPGFIMIRVRLVALGPSLSHLSRTARLGLGPGQAAVTCDQRIFAHSADAARTDDPEYAAEIDDMAARSGPDSPFCKRPD